ncbi:MAG TPA: hypothetical protein VNN13_03015 [Methylomirabilota bacterium]|nr:hypothetical protein [Methylomirabilota bacterium]
MVFVISGCVQSIPKEALELTPENLADRQRQTRRFATTDEKALLSASVAVLQDLGFTLESSATDLGLVVAAKELSAVEPGEVAVAVLVFAVTLLGGAPVAMPIDTKQKVRVSLTSKLSSENSENTLVRVTFQRVVWNNQGKVTKTEPLNEDKLYQDFFEKLSKAVFLDANEL